MAGSEAFDVQEWQTLQYVPWWVFHLIAGADADIDSEESRLLVDVLFDKPEYKSALACQLLASSSDEFQRISVRFMNDERKAADGLAEVEELLAGKIAEEEAADFKDAMVDVAKRIARAAGGFEQSEMEALAKISAALKI